MKRRRSEDDNQLDPFDLAHSSPSHSSSPANEGDLADTEADARTDAQPEAAAVQSSRHSGGGEPYSPAPPPPKKKRTRTLTTPHQSAVLHALLAQSRFPTTAMREEVGRAIGLSARKVQARLVPGKFYPLLPHNQRQKARRPGTRTHEGQGARSDLVRHSAGPYGVHVPGTTPPFSHYSSVSGRSTAGPSSFPGAMYSDSVPGGSGSGSGNGHYHDSRYLGGSRGAQLSGPGVPGPSSIYQAFNERPEGFERTHVPPGYSPHRVDYPTYAQPHIYPPPEPWAPSEEGRTPFDSAVYAPHRELSRNLPPLSIDEPLRLRHLPLEPALPPRRWSHLDPLESPPVPYHPVSTATTPRSRSPPIALPPPGAHPILPRLRIPSPPRTLISDDRALPPLTLPPLSSPSLPTSAPHETAESSPSLARGYRAPLSSAATTLPTMSQTLSDSSRESHLPPLSLRSLHTSPQASRTSTQATTLPTGPLPSPDVSSPAASRTRRFDPVRAAISDNESQGNTPPAESHV